jgi:hypothetical protein
MDSASFFTTIEDDDDSSYELDAIRYSRWSSTSQHYAYPVEKHCLQSSSNNLAIVVPSCRQSSQHHLVASPELS